MMSMMNTSWKTVSRHFIFGVVVAVVIKKIVVYKKKRETTDDL
jgi:hypothetical protein